MDPIPNIKLFTDQWNYYHPPPPVLPTKNNSKTKMAGKYYYKKKTRTYRKKRPNRKRTQRIFKSRVQRVINSTAETKMVYAEFTTNVSDTFLMNVLVPWPGQGVEAYGNIDDMQNTQGQRIGNVIKIKSIDWRFSIAADDATNIIRMIAFQWYDRSSSGVGTPDPDMILYSAAGGFPWLSPLNNANAKRYRILFDHTFKTVKEANSQQIVMHKKFYRRNLKTTTINFTADGSGSYSAEVLKGNIFYLIFSDSAVGGTLFNTCVRMNYIDM